MKIDTRDPHAGNSGLIALIGYRLPLRSPEEEKRHAHAGHIAGPRRPAPHAVPRSLGPAVPLEEPGIWAVPGHAAAQGALKDLDTFSSIGGIALTQLANAEILFGTVLATYGEQHSRLRRVLSRQPASGPASPH
ncbi:hypothetical protein ACFY8S_18880 [Streptomyces hygroscopicus]|uniref:hypothetical protein n=1 Tax=Streptomyces hygroscopicus TaxID=1912 RepID=UPI0036820E65